MTFSLRTLLIVAACALLAGALGGARYVRESATREAASAIIAAHENNLKHNDEVVYGWARSVDYLRRRLRAGDAPNIPVPGPSAQTDPTGGADGRSADDLPPAGELAADLATCQRQRARLIEDAAMTTIQLRELQEWAR